MSPYITRKNLEEFTFEELENYRRQALEQRNPIAFGEISDHLGETNFPEDSLEHELYQRYLAERIKLTNPVNPLIFQKPLFSFKMRIRDTIIHYRIESHKEAEQIISNLKKRKWTKINLTRIIEQVTQNSTFAKRFNNDYHALQRIVSIIYRTCKKLIK